MSPESSLTAFPQGTADALDKLRRDGAWHELARLLDALLGETHYAPPAARAALGDACRLSAGVVGRYVSTYRRILRISEENNVAPERLLSSSFNGCEVGCRIYDRSRSEGLDALLGLQERNYGLSTVRSILRNSSGPLINGSDLRAQQLRQRGLEIKTAERALADAAERLFGHGSKVRRRPGLRFFRRTGFEVVARDGSVAAGLDLLSPHPDQQRDELDIGFGASALLSTYFPKFHYICSPVGGDEIAARAVETVAHFGLRWFGVMRVDGKGAIQVLRAAKGRPEPDRTAQYDELKTRYTVGRRSG